MQSFMKFGANILRRNRPSNNVIKSHITPAYFENKFKTPEIQPLKYKSGDELPFSVSRTKLSKELPVYSDYRNSGSLRTTIVRRIEGNMNELADELSKVCDGKPIRIRNGSLEVKGAYNNQIKEYLTSLGF